MVQPCTISGRPFSDRSGSGAETTGTPFALPPPMDMTVTFWGVRGSIACSGPSVAKVGGNTPCVEVRAGTERLILDAGTGLRALGQRMLAEHAASGRGELRATLLFSHLHWDHIQGFPFFPPAYAPHADLRLFGPVAEDGLTTLKDALRGQMTGPWFPVPFGALPSTLRFETVRDSDDLTIGPFDIQMRGLVHPQGSLGYRIEAGGRRLCFATDTEHPERGFDPALLDLARDVDILIYDAQFTTDEYEGRSGPCRRGWGHSTADAATRIARAAGAKKLFLFHHDPGHDDPFIGRIEREARTRFAATWAAREGDTIHV